MSSPHEDDDNHQRSQNKSIKNEKSPGNNNKTIINWLDLTNRMGKHDLHYLKEAKWDDEFNVVT